MWCRYTRVACVGSHNCTNLKTTTQYRQHSFPSVSTATLMSDSMTACVIGQESLPNCRAVSCNLLINLSCIVEAEIYSALIAESLSPQCTHCSCRPPSRSQSTARKRYVSQLINSPVCVSWSCHTHMHTHTRTHTCTHTTCNSL